jgi:hypothetical protein
VLRGHLDVIQRTAVQFCANSKAASHQMEYTMPASATALRMIVVTPATSRMESWRGSNAMLVFLVPAERQH